MQRELENAVPGHRVVTMSVLALNLATGVGWVAAGVGLLGLRPWARRFAVGACAAVLLLEVGNTAYQMAVVYPAVGPAFDRAIQQMPQPMPFDMGGVVRLSFILGQLVALLPATLALVGLVQLRRPAVRAAFDLAAAAPAVDARGVEDEDDDWAPPAGPPSTGIREM